MQLVSRYHACRALALLLCLCAGAGAAQTLTNGGNHDGAILANQSNHWTFVASAGDRLVLRDGRLTGAGLNPWMRLFNPAGALIGDTGNLNNDIAHEIAVTTTNSGTFTVVVADSAFGGANDVGTYRLFFLRLPGTFVVADDGGALTNGANHDGEITIGDLDPWSFSMSAGEQMILRVGKLGGGSGFSPWTRIYGPDGVLVADSGALSVQAAYELVVTATNGGTFTVLVTDSNAGNPDDTGTYRLHFFKFPGAQAVADDSGPLINGGHHDAAITTGDLDAWSFNANVGDTVILRASRLGGDVNFNPWMRIYDEAGTRLTDTGTGSAQLVQEAVFTARNSGTFFALVGDGASGNLDDTGNYRLCFVKAPGSYVFPDDGGLLTNGVSATGLMERGDLDVWQFIACRGETVTFRLNRINTTNTFDPWVRLFGPDGALLRSQTGGAGVQFDAATTNTGLFTVVIGDGASGGLEGTGEFQIEATGILSDALQLCRPVITGAHLDLAGLGGTPGARFVLHTSTNLALPLAAWEPIYTNQFDNLGVFQKSDFPYTGEFKRFFNARQE